MFGDYEEKFDLMRLFLLYMFAHPGKKLTFMGTEFAQYHEWAYKEGIDFCLLEYPKHSEMKNYVRDLNWIYREYDHLYQEDFDWNGFEWINVDTNNNVIAFVRKNTKGEKMVCLFNFSPLKIKKYGIGIDCEGSYGVVLNTNEAKYGGNGNNRSRYHTVNESRHGKPYSIEIDLQPNQGILLVRR